MSQRSQTLRALVTERLTAAAEEIFVLVERTIAEYEEELCRSKEENQRKQQLLDSALGPQLLLHRTDAQIDWSPEPGLKQQILETPQIKEEPEEQSVRREEEQLPQFTAVCVKSEEPTEHREEQTDDDDDWEPAASTSAAQTETEADGDHYNQVQIRDTRPAAHYSALFNKDTSAAETGATGKTRKYQCTVCQKTFNRKEHLTSHTRVHTGEKPFWCKICQKVFSQKSHLRVHMRTHTGERPYTCPVCPRAFADGSSFRKHVRLHTGDKPHTCPICLKAFLQRADLKSHIRTHSEERPFTCVVCQKDFRQKGTLNKHMRSHRAEQL